MRIMSVDKGLVPQPNIEAEVTVELYLAFLL